MKQTLTIILTLIVGIAFFGCEGDDPTGSNGDGSQIMIVYAEHKNSYWDDDTQEEIIIENTTAGGMVLGDPIPEFVHLKLGGTVFSGDDYFEIYPGYVSFGNFDIDKQIMITSNFSPLDVEVKTSFGELNRTIFLPDTITTLILSEYDTLQIGESFTISWSGSNADFYFVACNYEWRDENDNTHYENLDGVVAENSITFSGSIFSHNGEITYIYVEPVNGPLPQEGTAGNMSGSGSGFLYYIADSINYEGDVIIVGSGRYGSMAKTLSKKSNAVVIQERIRKQIENKILGNQ